MDSTTSTQHVNGQANAQPIAEAARELRARGFAITFIQPVNKRPTHREWQLRSQEPQDYRPGCNIGILCGRLSGDLICIGTQIPKKAISSRR